MTEDINPKMIAEAILFISDRPVKLRILQRAMGIRSGKKAKKILQELMEEYSRRGGAIEIIELHGDSFFMKVKPHLLDRVSKYVYKQTLTHGVLKTLSLIAYHQPIEQTKVVEARGKDAYRQIKILIERGLVDAERIGRTYMLKTSELFADLIGVENNPSTIRKAIERISRQQEEKRKDKK